MNHEKITLVLGETTKLSAKAGIKSDDNRLSKDSKGRWGTTGSVVVINSDDLEKEEVEIVGSAIGKALVFYRQATVLTDAEVVAGSVAGGGLADARRQIDDAHAIAFEVEVVAPKKAAAPGAKKVGGAAAVAAGAAAGAAGLESGSRKFDHLLPTHEVQQEPSEKTPYGMNQENKPVAPNPGMVNPNDDSSVARASEPPAPAGANAKSSKKAASKKGSKKASKKASKGSQSK